MSTFKALRGVGAATCLAIGLLSATAGGAMARPAGPIYWCVPSAAGGAVLSGTETGECKKGYSTIGMPSNAEEQEKRSLS